MALVQVISIASAAVRLHFLLSHLIIQAKNFDEKGKKEDFNFYSHPTTSELTGFCDLRSSQGTSCKST